MSAAPLSFWEDKFWHHRLHQRLGETLFYYLIRVRPFDLHEVSQSLKELLAEKHIGSIRVFPIFGSYDLLIRAWLHPSIAASFRGWLDSNRVLQGSARTVHPFSVDYIHKRWYDRIEINPDLLESLDEDAIRSVQRGEDISLLEELINQNIVLVRQRTRDIQFFTAMNFEHGAVAVDAVNGLKQYLTENPKIKNASVYGGFGFCSILFKGQVDDYFNISDLPNWIIRKFKMFGASTETFVVQGPSHIVGSEVIGEATFHALRGRDLFVQSIIPEIYEIHYSRRSTVERLLLSEDISKSDITQRDKRLIHDYVMGYLEDDPTQMAKTLFTFFLDLESYLQKNHKEFIARVTQGSVKKVYTEANIDNSRKHLTLGDVLRLYSLAIKLSNLSENAHLIGGWEGLVKLRNDLVHGAVDILSDWRIFYVELVKYLPKVRQLFSLVEQITGNVYRGQY